MEARRAISGANGAITAPGVLEVAHVDGDAFELLDPSKSRCSWLDRDTLFLGADLKGGDLTSSGYPRTVREWKRGADPKDAPVVFEGEARRPVAATTFERFGVGER